MTDMPDDWADKVQTSTNSPPPTVTPFPKKPRRPKPEAKVIGFPAPPLEPSNGDEDWPTAIHCLEALIRDIRCGKLNPQVVYVAMRCDDHAKQASTYPSYTWAEHGRENMITTMETIGLLEIHKVMTLGEI